MLLPQLSNLNFEKREVSLSQIIFSLKDWKILSSVMESSSFKFICTVEASYTELFTSDDKDNLPKSKLSTSSSKFITKEIANSKHPNSVEQTNLNVFTSELFSLFENLVLGSLKGSRHP